MNRALLIFLVWSSPVLADTFELQDPAAEIYSEKQAPPETEQPEEKLQIADELFCAVDEKEGKCWCVHKQTAKVVNIEHEECVIIAAEVSSSKP
jgi:hypothetical protein